MLRFETKPTHAKQTFVLGSERVTVDKKKNNRHWQHQTPHTPQHRHNCPPSKQHAGATGLIGSRLAAELASRGATVRVLTRDPAEAARKLPAAGRKYEYYGPSDWAAAVTGADAVVNLAGTPIGTRCVYVWFLMFFGGGCCVVPGRNEEGCCAV
jgi:hypothetical protein